MTFTCTQFEPLLDLQTGFLYLCNTIQVLYLTICRYFTLSGTLLYYMSVILV